MTLTLTDMPVSSDDLLTRLRDHGISFNLFEHEPLRTVEDAKLVQSHMDPNGTGFHIKNLYLRDAKKRNVLVSLEQDQSVDLKALAKQIETGKLSFGSADRLMEYLGVLPGAVSPLTMVTGAATGVTAYLDRRMRAACAVYMHPLINTRSIVMSGTDLEKTLTLFGAAPIWIDFP
ncbi:MAG: prolyl-tRNA synthetase associated domain-containing protein [Paracoccaceae bacterium]|jgi:Ala-tRNA(Pro) deacylase